jgi:hypothetical protein
MRGTTHLKSVADRFETRLLGGASLVTFAYGFLFWMAMIYAVTSMRFPIDPSLVEPPFRPYCGFLTGLNLALAVLLAEGVSIMRSDRPRRLLRWLPPMLGLASVVCIQLVVEILRDLRVG